MKERLTGAIILVVLIVLLVPELLSGPSRSAPAPQAAATSSEEPPLRSYTIDLADEPRTPGGASSSSVTPQGTGPSHPETIVESPAAGQTETPAAGQGESPPVGKAGSQAAGQVESHGAGQVVSPATGQMESDAARQAAGAKTPTPSTGSSHRAPPEQRLATADKPASEWMVQLGVFRKHDNAERLVQELKQKGFHALVSEVSVGGQTLWRVRAGPVAERAAAEQLNAKLRTAGHAGSVVPK